MMRSMAPLVVTLSGEAEMIQFGEDLALAAQRGDCVAFTGDLGAGKSTLARAFLRAMADDDALEVPSPTFTLVQNYDLRLPVAHFDLYRLSDPSELEELGFDEALDLGICLVEWPQRAEGALPARRINIAIDFIKDGRRLTISGADGRLQRIARVIAIRDFLRANGLGEARRRYLIGDASVRSYERLFPAQGPGLILMDAAERPSGAVVEDGLSYPELVHLALTIDPFVAVDRLLRDAGFAAPEIICADFEQGLLVLEDLGPEGILDAAGQPIADRYRESVICLAHLHGKSFARSVEVVPGHIHHIPDFDRRAMKIEASLIVDWHIGWRRGAPPSATERKEFFDIWDGLIDQLGDVEKTLLLRDYHSPNIIWRGEESGLASIGIIDFQDAMFGPSAYDLASIVQDARTTIPPALADDLMEAYLSVRRSHPGFNEALFLKAFAIMAAQRACKLNGLWVRLLQRDGKEGYLQHMPRTLAYLAAAMQHPVLAPLRAWCLEAGIISDAPDT